MVVLQAKAGAFVLSFLAVAGLITRSVDTLTGKSQLVRQSVQDFLEQYGTLGNGEESDEFSQMPCDPTKGPGWVTEGGYFQRSDMHCPSHDFVNRFSETPKEDYLTEFAPFANKTLFLLGDSVTRHLWDELCDAIGAPKQWLHPDGPEVPYQEVPLCIQPELNMTVIQYHQYGFANATDEKTVEVLKKCFPGGPNFDFETRVPELFDTLLKGYTPDYVQVGGGAWDFLYMYNRDILEHRHHESLPESDLRTIVGRQTELFHLIQEMFPDSKLLWLNVHPLNSDDLKVKHIWGGGYFYPTLETTKDSPLLPPLFSQRRLAQHAQALRQSAREAGVDDVDYWKLRDSFSVDDFWAPGDAVHPHQGPRVAMIGMMLEKLYRWAEYGV